MKQPFDAIQRLTAWIENYGHEKQPEFIADLRTVLAAATDARQIERLAEYYEKVAGHFELGDVRTTCFADVAKDLREILGEQNATE